MLDITPELLGKYLPRLTVAPRVIIQPSLTSRHAECIARLGTFSHPLLVADSNTFAALGKTVAEELGLRSDQVLILEGDVHARMETAEKIASKASGCDLIIAVGSGTINDLCKYASHVSNVPSVIFPTAPSMNGYVSATSSLLKDGLKTSYASALPIGVFCDLGVLANAPYRLIRSGIGDMLCRATVQADWLLSNLLLDTTYDKAPFELLKPFEKTVMENAALFPVRDANSVLALMKGLLIGGFGMTMCGGSYPASQGEHIIAHALEKLYPEKMVAFFHGEHIAVTTLYMEKLQRAVLNSRIEPTYRFPAGKNWQDIKSNLQAVMLPDGALEYAMKKAELPTTPEDIKITQAEFTEAVKIAPTLRNRFGFLNLN